MCFPYFQSIEKDEPIEVDHTPTHGGLENGHSATTGTMSHCSVTGRKTRMMSPVVMYVLIN